MITPQHKIRYSILFLLITLSSTAIFGQEATPKNNKANRMSKLIQEKAGRPDIPGDLMIEYGFNWVQEHPEGVGFKNFNSRTFNAYYLFERNIGETAFSFHPGVGIGTERYTFADEITLGYGLDSLGENVVQFVPLDSLYGLGVSYRKSQFSATYLDIPIEFRWRSRKYDPKRSFKVTIGGKIGIMFDSKSKIKYEEDGEVKITKQKENFDLSTIRYGAYAKVGFGGFSAFYYYSFSDVFRKDKGPMATTMFPMTLGLSLALF